MNKENTLPLTSGFTQAGIRMKKNGVFTKAKRNDKNQVSAL